MEPIILFQPVHSGTDGSDEDGHFAVADGEVVSLLVRRASPNPAQGERAWHLKVGFHSCLTTASAPFPSLVVAERWIRQALVPYVVG